MRRPVTAPAVSNWPHRRNACWSPCERVVLRRTGSGRTWIVARHHPGDTVPITVRSLPPGTTAALIADTAQAFLDAAKVTQP